MGNTSRFARTPPAKRVRYEKPDTERLKAKVHFLAKGGHLGETACARRGYVTLGGDGPPVLAMGEGPGVTLYTITTNPAAVTCAACRRKLAAQEAPDA